MNRSALRPVGAVVAGALALLVVLASAGAASGLVAPPAVADDDRVVSSMPESPLIAQQVDADNTLLRIDLQANGDAAWTVEYRVQLSNENETAAFQTIVDDVESNPQNYTSEFEARMSATAGTAANATGRDMAVENVSVSAKIQEVPKFGIVTYTFEWTNFAAVEGSTITAGDALSGLFLDSGTRLVMAWPDGYERGSVDPQPGKTSGSSVEWAGPTEFTEGQPTLVVEKAGPLSGNGLLYAGAAIFVIGGLVAVVLWRRRSGGAVEVPAPTPSGSEVATEGGSDAAAAGAAGGAAGGAAADSGGDDEEEAEPPEELLSNEERVLKVMREHGGRMKQQEVVEELGWTEAKTSQVVRSLRDEGDLEGFRLGRENVLRLPEGDEDAPDGA